MIIHQTPIPGLATIHLEKKGDERGWFARTFCVDELQKSDISFQIQQANRSFTQKKGALRGMHFQADPHGEGKIVSCIQGAIYDVAIDLRKDSDTYTQWFGIELTSEEGTLFYIPPGFAHGFQTLTENCVVEYFMSAPYVADAATGVRWNDPAFNITWPINNPTEINEKDMNWPLLK